MRIRILPGRELGPVEIGHWRRIQAGNPALGSPYFCPEFTQAVAAVRDDVFVAVLEDAGKIAGFFPYHRRRFGLGGPVGGRLNDVHGLVLDSTPDWGWPLLLRGCRLARWEYHAALGSQVPRSSRPGETMDSHVLDLDGGLDAYLARLKAGGSTEYQGLQAKKRKLLRQYGSLDFAEHLEDHALLDTLIDWKSRQYRERGVIDNFAFQWTRDLLHRILATDTEFFAGRLSVLRVDGEPAAIHLGLRSRTVWHWWFPRHDERFGKFSPGAQMLAAMAEHAARAGLRTLDLGYGDEPYKFRFRTGAYPVLRGSAEVASIAGAVLRSREAAERWVRSGPLYALARIPGRLWTRWERSRRLR